MIVWYDPMYACSFTPLFKNFLVQFFKEAFVWFWTSTQPVFACSKLTIKTLEQVVNYAQS